MDSQKVLDCPPTLGSFPWCFALAYVRLFSAWARGGRPSNGSSRYLDIVVIVGFVALVGYLIYHRETYCSACARTLKRPATRLAIPKPHLSSPPANTVRSDCVLRHPA